MFQTGWIESSRLSNLFCLIVSNGTRVSPGPVKGFARKNKKMEPLRGSQWAEKDNDSDSFHRVSELTDVDDLWQNGNCPSTKSKFNGSRYSSAH